MIDPTSASSIQSMMETIRSYQSQAASSTNAAGMANSASSAQQMGLGGMGGVGGANATSGAYQAKNISAPTTELPNFTDSVRNLLNKVNDVNVNSEKMAYPCRAQRCKTLCIHNNRSEQGFSENFLGLLRFCTSLISSRLF